MGGWQPSEERRSLVAGWRIMDAARHFGLSRDPFAPLGEREEALAGGPYARAYEEVLAALAGGSRLLVIVGSRGAGKTLLLRDLGRLALAEGRRIAQAAHGQTPSDTVAAKADLLLVDDADQLPEQALDALASRAAAPAGPVVVLAGLRRGLGRLRRIARPAIVELTNLEPDEARAFVVGLIERADGRADLFDAQALDLITTAAGGSARRLSALAGSALTLAARDGSRHVGQAHARRAIDVVDANAAPPATQAASPAQNQPGRTAPRPTGEAVAPRPMPVTPPARSTETEFHASAASPSPPATSELRHAPLRGAGVVRARLLPAELSRQAYRLRGPLVAFAALIGLLVLTLPLIGERASTNDEESARAPAVAPAPASQPELPPAVDDRRAGAVNEPTAPAVDDIPAAQEIPVAEEAVPAAPEPEPAPIASVETPDGNRDADAAPGATARQPAPPASGRRVFIHYTRGTPGAEAAAIRLASELEETGYTVADIRGVPVHVGRASTRFFFREDQDAAITLNRRIGNARLIDMTDYPRPPRRGTLEVWLPTR